MNAWQRFVGLTLAVIVVIAATSAPSVAQKKQQDVWIDPADASLPADARIQGEYVGALSSGEKIAAQVIALGDMKFQAVVYHGGLPGEGWDEQTKLLLDGAADADGRVQFVPPEGERKYMDGKPERFSATREFPPKGQAAWRGAIVDGKFTGTATDDKTFTLERIERKSPTLGAAPPDGAVVLFDGKSGEHWSGGRVDERGVLHTDAKDVKSVGKFSAYKIHLEFLLPFRPKARSQGRGNSGFYQTNGMEVQVLDSFGLEGIRNECGGLYGRADCRINMCYPPLTWQTYDVELLPAGGDDKNAATLTVRHNGVVIHDKVPCKLGGGGFTLQGHGNLLQYRNIWLVEHKEPLASE